MFRKLNNLNFRVIVMVSLGAPLLLIWIAGYYAWDSWRTYRIMVVTIQANNLADRVITAAGLQAIERGVTAGLLSASGPATEAARGRVSDQRIENGPPLLRGLDFGVGANDLEPAALRERLYLGQLVLGVLLVGRDADVDRGAGHARPALLTTRPRSSIAINHCPLPPGR